MNVLAVGAHAADLVLLCGGTLARYAQGGQQVSLLIMCRGDSPFDEFTEAAAQRRAAEYQQAAAVIGAETRALGLGDFSLRDTPEIRRQLIEVIRQVQPAVIVTHDPADYCGDHGATGALMPECLHMAQLPGIKTDSPPLGHHPELAYMDTVSGLGFEPEQFVDITSVMDLKRRMAQALATEVEAFRNNPVVETFEWMEVTARYRGIQCGVRYAEAFRRRPIWGQRSEVRFLP